MRLWSLHPKYLDAKGLIALWREGLLAKKVLEGRTKGYKNHPQLERFKKSNNPEKFINQYLYCVYLEAKSRGYNFDLSKINSGFKLSKIKIKKGQAEYEFSHLKNKLLKRDIKKLKEIQASKKIVLNSIFALCSGGVEDWEILEKKN